MADMEHELADLKAKLANPTDISLKLELMLDLLSPLPSPTLVTENDVAWDAHSHSSVSTAVIPINSKTRHYDPKYQINLEVAIEKQRIAYVLDRTIDKLELIVSLPQLIENNAAVLKPFCTDDELATVMACCNNYLEASLLDAVEVTAPQHSVSPTLGWGTSAKQIKVLGQGDAESKNHGEHTSCFADTKTMKFKTKQCMSTKSRSAIAAKEGRQDPQVFKAVELLFSKPRLRNIGKENLLSKISPSAAGFLDNVRGLRECTLSRLAVSPRAKRAIDRKLRALWLENEQLKAEVAELRQVAEGLINETNSKLAEKHVRVNKHEEKINMLDAQYAEEQEMRINKAEGVMLSRRKASQCLQAGLKVELADAQRMLRDHLPKHLARERDLRSMRYNRESQFLALIAKYDDEMGKRQKELDRIIEEYKAEKKRMADLKEQFDIQEKEYNRLMDEKEAEAQQELENQIYTFLLTRSARRIQRYWRAYRARKISRRKSKRKPHKDSPKVKGKASKTNFKSKT